MKFFFEMMQPLEVVKLVDMIINVMQCPFNAWITAVFSHTGKWA